MALRSRLPNVPGFGVRCVVPNPWVTGGESSELALALWAVGESDRALEVLQSIQHLREPESGLYWTGYVFEDDAIRQMIDTPRPVIFDCRVENAENCLPMIPSGMTVKDIIKA